jgi:hypothetical protein
MEGRKDFAIVFLPLPYVVVVGRRRSGINRLGHLEARVLISGSNKFPLESGGSGSAVASFKDSTLAGDVGDLSSGRRWIRPTLSSGLFQGLSLVRRFVFLQRDICLSPGAFGAAGGE